MKDNKELHEVTIGAMELAESIKALIIPLTYSEGAEIRLAVKKSLYDMDFYLKVMELGTRTVSDKEYNSEKYLRECDKYGI